MSNDKTRNKQYRIILAHNNNYTSIWSKRHSYQAKAEEKISLMLVLYSLIFFTFAHAFDWCEYALKMNIYRSCACIIKVCSHVKKLSPLPILIMYQGIWHSQLLSINSLNGWQTHLHWNSILWYKITSVRKSVAAKFCYVWIDLYKWCLIVIIARQQHCRQKNSTLVFMFFQFDVKRLGM